jgi:hypothetical protein
MMYEFPMTGTWEIDLPFTMFGAGITLEATIVLTVDGLSWSGDRDEDDSTLQARTLWDEDTAEFEVSGGTGGINATLLSEHDEAQYVKWVKAIIDNTKPVKVRVDDPRTMSKSEWEGD